MTAHALALVALVALVLVLGALIAVAWADAQVTAMPTGCPPGCRCRGPRTDQRS